MEFQLGKEGGEIMKQGDRILSGRNNGFEVLAGRSITGVETCDRQNNVPHPSHPKMSTS